MNIPNTAVKQMLNNIKDPKLRTSLGSIISGKITHLVKCESDNCQGRVIAHITQQGRVEELPPVANKTRKGGTLAQKLYSSGLEGHRQRFDGEWGFRCYCGNVSVLCAEEQGVITPARPTESDLVKVANRLARRKGEKYAWHNGKKVVDGFTIEEVRV